MDNCELIFNLIKTYDIKKIDLAYECKTNNLSDTAVTKRLQRMKKEKLSKLKVDELKSLVFKIVRKKSTNKIIEKLRKYEKDNIKTLKKNDLEKIFKNESCFKIIEDAFNDNKLYFELELKNHNLYDEKNLILNKCKYIKKNNESLYYFILTCKTSDEKRLKFNK